MSWKKTDLEPLKGASINDRLDHSQGLVPFAVTWYEGSRRGRRSAHRRSTTRSRLLESGLEAISKR